MGGLNFPAHLPGSTGNSRATIRNMGGTTRLEAEFVVEAVGATPTVTFTVEGLVPGGDPTVAADWVVLALETGDSTVAASNTPIAVTAVGSTRRYVSGLADRFYDAFSIKTVSNTNVTYRSNLNRWDTFN